MSSILKKEHQTELQTDEQHQIETKNTGTATADTSAKNYRTRRPCHIATNQFAGHGVARPSIFYDNYVDIRNESIYKRIKVLIKFVCKLPFTFYLYSLIQFFNFRTKIPLRPHKTAIAQTPIPPNGHWPFCMTKVGTDVVPKQLSKKGKWKQTQSSVVPKFIQNPCGTDLLFHSP